MSIELQSSIPYIVIKNQGRDWLGKDWIQDAIINDHIGTLNDVMDKGPFSPISHAICQRLGMEKHYDLVLNDYDAVDEIFVNWKIISRNKNHQGRLALFSACEQGLKWSDGLGEIVKGYGAAIEERDEVTGLEAFMLSAAGPKSSCSLETIFSLLQDHPAAINPYVAV